MHYCSPLCSIPALKGLDNVYPHKGELPALLSPPIQMVISGNIFIVTLRINVQSTICASLGPIKLTYKITITTLFPHNFNILRGQSVLKAGPLSQWICAEDNHYGREIEFTLASLYPRKAQISASVQRVKLTMHLWPTSCPVSYTGTVELLKTQLFFLFLKRIPLPRPIPIHSLCLWERWMGLTVKHEKDSLFIILGQLFFLKIRYL